MFRLWLRRMLLGAAGLLALCVAVVAWLVASFDGERYKAVAVDWMRVERQRTLSIAGPARLSVFPRLQISFGGLRLSERFKPEAEFLLLDEASLSVEVVPLLASQLVVKGVVAHGVRINLTRAADGTRNVDDLIGVSGGGSGAVKFDLRQVALEDVRAAVRDERLPLQGEYRIEHLAAQMAPGHATRIDLRSRLALEQPGVEGALEGEFSWWAGSGDGPSRLSDIELRFTGRGAGLRDVTAELRGNARLDLTHDDIEGEGLALGFEGGGDGWQLEPSTLRLQRIGWQAAGGAFAWTGLELALKGRIGADRRFTASLESPQFGLTHNGIVGQGVKGQAEVTGSGPMRVSFRTGAASGRPDLMRLSALRAEVKADLAGRRLEGTVAGDLLLRPSASGREAERVSVERLDVKGVLDPGHGGTPWPLAARGTLELTPAELSWNLTATLAEDSCAGEGSARPAKAAPERPFVSLRLRCDRLDLGRWGPSIVPEAPDSSSAAQPASAAVPSSTAGTGATPDGVGLQAWRTVDTNISLRATQLRMFPLVARDVRLDTTLVDGLLKLSGGQARIWDGAVELGGQADLGLTAAEPNFDLRLNANGIDVAALLHDLSDSAPLAGRGRVTAELRGSGHDLQALRRSLDGRASLQLRDGAITGTDLLHSLRKARASLADGQDTTEPARPDQKTPFSELRASFEVDDGIAVNRDLDVRGPLWQLGGEGRLDLRSQQLDYQARANVAAPRHGASGASGADEAELAPLQNLSVPLRIHGPIEAADWQIRWSEIAHAPREASGVESVSDVTRTDNTAAASAAPAAAPKASAP